jgi:hypothetical protein
VLSLGILTLNMAADWSMARVLFVRFTRGAANPGRAAGRAAGDFFLP